ncbi:MAG: 4-hydroxythreonine-4-phosphate dehydrogenase PdxA [Acidobacteria bacterium]|nr:4-hydroxythreonine-4-phosphate dehydrogenase PdxA [Acidobacteriota bacterium]
MTARIRVGITVGDPAGIGPEIARAAVLDPRVTAVCEPVLYDAATDDGVPVVPGVLSAEAGRAAYDAVVRATADAMAGRIDAVTTGPIHKEAFALAGLPWRGHTELLAHLTGADEVAMMFYSSRLCVVLATVHVPLSAVPRLLTRQRVEATLALTAAELPRFGIPVPRLGLAGLNPHAGEGGLLGSEEQDVLAPAVASARARGIDVTGPLPADTVFRQAVDGRFDAVVACYHDQGLIPVKLVAFGEAVNVTLGLPIIRTSVDHGTAFDIAGKGIADPSSLVTAVELAARLASGRARECHERGH